jgi:hypothetical protein
MSQTKQEAKYSKSIAGEFFVAAQLQRQGMLASVTYGNAKRTDVVAFAPGGEKAAVIEVKSTSGSKWKVGSRCPEPSEQRWVFVYLPEKFEEAPSFYLLTQSEIHKILKPSEEEYFRKYKQKHGKEYGDKPGFTAISLKQIESHKNRWDKIKALL